MEEDKEQGLRAGHHLLDVDMNIIPTNYGMACNIIYNLDKDMSELFEKGVSPNKEDISKFTHKLLAAYRYMQLATGDVYAKRQRKPMVRVPNTGRK